jgi:hypothetical protein
VGAPTVERGRDPCAFTGGTIKKVVVDLSGDHYVDLEHEAIAAMKRD